MTTIKVATPSQISHEFIECDHCGKSNPKNRCSRCHTTYYCSRECQRQHWKKQHKQSCVDVQENRKRFNDFGKDVPSSKIVGSIMEGPCVICLEETITSPVVLDCSHVFCFKCLDDYQQTLHASNGTASGEQNDKLKCPYCRGEMPDLRLQAFDRARLYGQHAFMLPIGSDERKKYVQLAVAGLDAILKSDKEDCMTLLIKGKLLLDDDPETAVRIFQEILLGLDKKYSKTTGDYWKGFFDTKLHLAKAYQAMKAWKKSNEVYDSIRGHRLVQVECDMEQKLELPMGYSRNFYELGVYNESIKYGNFARESCRNIKGVHKYVALSQKAIGDVGAAKKTLSRAVLYETPWDEENMKNNLQMLNELA